MDKSVLKIEFDSEAAAEHFIRWLDGQGEQDYWIWMECRERKEKGNITVKQFIRDDTDKLLVHTECGRISK